MLAHAIKQAESEYEVLYRWSEAICNFSLSRPTTTRFVLSAVYGPPNKEIIEQIFGHHARIKTLITKGLTHHNEALSAARISYAIQLLPSILTPFIFYYLEGMLEELNQPLVESTAQRVAAALHDEHHIPTQILFQIDSIFNQYTAEDD